MSQRPARVISSSLPICGDQPIEGWLRGARTRCFTRRITPADNPSPHPAARTLARTASSNAGPRAFLLPAARSGLACTEPMADGPPVVWWDPTALSLEVEEQAPLRHQRILEADPDGTAATASEESYAAWKRRTRSSARQGLSPVNVGAHRHVAGPRSGG